MGGRTNLDLDRPRLISEMLTGAFALYWRVPILFLAFAAMVVVPYELIVLAITGTGPSTTGHLSFVAQQELLVADSFLVTPLISALHVYAIREVGDGGRPTFIGTIRRGLPRLPVVAVAAGISGVAIGLGGLAFGVPGLVLAAMWPVVAQAAALEGGSPIDALRRSFGLTRGKRWHSLWLILAAGLVAAVPGVPLFVAFRHSATTAGTFIAGTAVQIVVRSFEALATGLLYFDLVARERVEPLGLKTPPVVGLDAAPAARRLVPPTGHPADPDSWSDHDRPTGWYIDPAAPWRMRHWATDGSGTGAWGENSTKTPRQTRAELERLGEKRRGPGLGTLRARLRGLVLPVVLLVPRPRFGLVALHAARLAVDLALDEAALAFQHRLRHHRGRARSGRGRFGGDERGVDAGDDLRWGDRDRRRGVEGRLAAPPLGPERVRPGEPARFG